MVALDEVLGHLTSEDASEELMVDVYGCSDLSGGKFPRFSQDPFSRKDFHRDRLRVWMPRLGVAALWYYVCVYLNNLSQAWLQKNMAGFYESQWGYSAKDYPTSQAWLKKHMPEVYKSQWGATPPNMTQAYAPEAMHKWYQNKTVTLYDFGFLYLPEVSTSLYADIFAGVSGVGAIVRFVVVPGPMSLRWAFLCRICFVWGALFLCRAITILVTPLPNPYHECKPAATFPNNVWLEAFANLPGLSWNELTCQDVLFSGHTAMGTTCTVFAMRYCRKAPWSKYVIDWQLSDFAIHLAGWLWLCYGWFVISASHFHYTIDVVIAAVLTFICYSYYHSVIYSVWLRKARGFESPFATFLRWFEAHSYDVTLWREQAETLMATDRLVVNRLLSTESRRTTRVSEVQMLAVASPDGVPGASGWRSAPLAAGMA